MGTDFLIKKARRFNKTLNTRRVELARTDLFSREAGEPEMRVVAKSIGDGKLVTGDRVRIRCDDRSLVIEKENMSYATAIRPQDAIVDRVSAIGGYADGVVARVYPTMDLVEVAFVP